jgi:Rrf2 family protein
MGGSVYSLAGWTGRRKTSTISRSIVRIERLADDFIACPRVQLCAFCSGQAGCSHNGQPVEALKAMIFSSTTEYAMRGLSELASRSTGGSMLLDQLVSGTDLPRDFMAKVFQKLVKAGLLRSAKGRGGGFTLARPAHEITLMHIVEAIEGPQRMDQCVVGLDKCTDYMPCPQHDLYKPIRQRLKDYLSTTTVADLAASLKAKQTWQKIRLEQSDLMPQPQEE